MRPSQRVTVTVDVEPRVEWAARQRAQADGDQDRFEEWLLDHLLFEYEFRFGEGEPWG